MVFAALTVFALSSRAGYLIGAVINVDSGQLYASLR
jgi:hypothetical protein